MTVLTTHAPAWPPPACVLLFPGHGASTRMPPHVHAAARAAPHLFAAVDAIANDHRIDPPSQLLSRPPGATPVDPRQQELALLAAGVALHNLLRARGLHPHTLLGHSLGLLTALTCAQAFTLEDAALAILRRARVVREHGPRDAGMLAIHASVPRTHDLLAAANRPDLEIACHNAPHQQTVSGKTTSLTRLAELADLQGPPCVRLRVSHPYHSTAMTPVVAPMRYAIAATPQHALRTPVYSSGGHGYHTDTDDLRTEMARSIAEPVHFHEAVLQLHRQGARSYMECGPSTMILNFAAQALPQAHTYHLPL